MTCFRAFDALTWPDVAALPRGIPLALPLGGGYDLDELARALGQPEQAALLPALPYGWNGSPLALPEAAFEPLLANLLENLREDGFQRVTTVFPRGLENGPRVPHLSLPSREFPAGPLLPGEEDRGKVVLIPAGHTEQHGRHLPLATDTLIIDAIARGTAEQAPAEAVALPVFPYGVSTYRSSFAGTFNCGGRAFEDFFLAVIAALVGRGFEKFYLLSGHGGNCSFFANVVKYAGERHTGIFCATAWLYLSGPEGAAALERARESRRGGMGHACELETSLILRLRPDLVHMERVVDEVDFITTPSYDMDWIEGGPLAANPPWEDESPSGAIGAGSLGTAAKGRFWLEAAIDEKVGHVHEIDEQYRRRKERREKRKT